MVMFQFILGICDDNSKNPVKSSNSLIENFFQLIFAMRRGKMVVSQRGCRMMLLDKVRPSSCGRKQMSLSFSLEIRWHFVLLFKNRCGMQYSRRNILFDFN